MVVEGRDEYLDMGLVFNLYCVRDGPKWLFDFDLEVALHSSRCSSPIMLYVNASLRKIVFEPPVSVIWPLGTYNARAIA